ncbi:MAG: nitric oxide dioxygenase, partial [Cellvibrionaceae bacterium]
SKALGDAVVAYAKNIDKLESLLPVVKRIAHKHVSVGVEQHHYPIVGETLLEAIADVLDLSNNHPAIIAWAEAYNLLANIFISTESSVRKANAERQHGWVGFKKFKIHHIERETPLIKSFYLLPRDGSSVPSFSAGQYIGVKVNTEGSKYTQIRQYSLSKKWAFRITIKADIEDSNYIQMRQYSLSKRWGFRITVKAEPQGLASNFLHDCVKGDSVYVQSPTGVFTLSGSPRRKIFIAGGVGATPLMCMLHEAAEKSIDPSDILFIQCVNGSSDRVFHNELLNLRSKFDYHYKLCVEEADVGDHRGRLNQEILTHWMNELNFHGENSEVYLCGPTPFMSGLKQMLLQSGFADDHLHYEVFGPRA